MTIDKCIGVIFGLILAVFCLLISRRFSHKRLKQPKNNSLCQGKITELDDERFTVEYECKHQPYYYTTLKKDYYALFGYTTVSKLTPEEEKSFAEEERLLKTLLRRGYSYDCFFSLHIGTKILVWTETDKPYNVLRIHNDNSSTNKSVGRVFRALGIFILLAVTMVLVYSLR